MSEKRPSHFVYKAEIDRTRRNAAERFRTLKNRVLLNCLREMLPPNNVPSKKRKMSDLEVINNAIRYIKILTDTLTVNDVTQRTAQSMIDAGLTECAAMHLMKETEKEQKPLEEEIEHRLIKHYGSCCPSIGNTTPKDKIEIETILSTLQNTSFLGNRHDSLGNKSNPLSLGLCRHKHCQQ